MRHVIFERSYISKARITVIIIIMSSYVLDPNMLEAKKFGIHLKAMNSFLHVEVHHISK